MTEEIRPICLYVETCLDRKEGTRDCAKCEHHLNYWTEVMIRDMEKNINRLEQENKDLKKQIESDKGLITVGGKQQYQYLQRIDALEQENKELKEMLSKEPKAMQAFQISYSGLKRDNETLWGMVKDYKTALEEIREMCNKHLDAKEICYATQVIDKIDEVLNPS